MSELSVGQLKGLTVNSNVVTVPAGHTLYAPGHVIQSHTITSGNQSTTSTSYQTWVSKVLTPKLASSKILCSVNVSQAYIDTARGTGYWAIFRDGVSVFEMALESQAAAACLLYGSFQYLDSPNTTSAVTYEVKYKRAANAGYLQSGGTSSFVVQEIAQ